MYIRVIVSPIESWFHVVGSCVCKEPSGEAICHCLGMTPSSSQIHTSSAI